LTPSNRDTLQTGLVFDVQRFCVHDGPGIRTVVFFKGCPLRCKWCQNPEGIDPRPEIGFSLDRCIGCGECETACPAGAITPEGAKRIDRSLCDRCGECVEVCYARALQLIGKPYTPEALLDEVVKDRAFFDSSGGGITLSGGEPTSQHEFLTTFLPLAKERGLHVAMETCGYAPSERLEAIIPFLDLILYDIKAVDSSLHKRLTGHDNEVILGNFDRLLRARAEITVRVPLIPGLTATNKNLKDICLFLKSRGIMKVNLLPYHKMGEGKLEKIDSPLRPLNLGGLNEGELADITSLFQDAGIEAIY